MVKCSECGLLGFRSLQTQQVEEAVESIRFDGTFPVDPARPGYRLHDGVPICVKGAFSLLDETINVFIERGESPA